MVTLFEILRNRFFLSWMISISWVWLSHGSSRHDADLVDEKWTAAVRVLADTDAAGATYIDVRLPERPVAGGLPVETIEPVAPAGDVIAPPVEPTTPDPTVPVDPTVTTTTPEPVPAPATTPQP